MNVTVEATGKQFRFAAVVNGVIIDELGSIDQHIFFTSKSVDRCVDQFYDVR
jgi:hypothetical protein